MKNPSIEHGSIPLEGSNLYPHYSDPRFGDYQPHTVYTAPDHLAFPDAHGRDEVLQARYIYDDRIPGHVVSEVEAEFGDERTTPRVFQALVQKAVGEDVDLVHIMAYIDRRTWDPRHIYGFIPRQ